MSGSPDWMAEGEAQISVFVDLLTRDAGPR
jgi:hypothetical protein